MTPIPETLRQGPLYILHQVFLNLAYHITGMRTVMAFRVTTMMMMMTTTMMVMIMMTVLMMTKTTTSITLVMIIMKPKADADDNTGER